MVAIWVKQWLAACLAPSNYLNQPWPHCTPIVVAGFPRLQHRFPSSGHHGFLQMARWHPDCQLMQVYMQLKDMAINWESTLLMIAGICGTDKLRFHCFHSLFGDKIIDKAFKIFEEIPHNLPRQLSVNSLGPSDAIWRQRSGSTLAQVMACCLMAPSHYLNQCWLIISKFQWHSSEAILWKRCLNHHSFKSVWKLHV